MTVTPEQIEAAKARDKRFSIIEAGSALAAELRDSQAVRLFMAAMRKDAEAALYEFAEISLAETGALMQLQVRVRNFTYLSRTIDNLMQQSQVAEQQIIAESDGYDV